MRNLTISYEKGDWEYRLKTNFDNSSIGSPKELADILAKIIMEADMPKGSAVYYYESVNKENPKLYVMVAVEQGVMDNNNDQVYDIWVEDWADDYDPNAGLKETVSENPHLLSQKELAHDHNLADMDKAWDWIEQHATLEDSMWATKQSFKEAMEGSVI